MSKRIHDKAAEIKKYVEELSEIAPHSFSAYASSLEKKAACERYVEKIAEALTDLAFLAIKGKKLAIPEDDIDAFRILQESGLIEPSIAQKMRNVKGMRNIIAHQYGTIDDEVIFHSVKEELGKDALAFSERIRKRFQP